MTEPAAGTTVREAAGRTVVREPEGRVGVEVRGVAAADVLVGALLAVAATSVTAWLLQPVAIDTVAIAVTTPTTRRSANFLMGTFQIFLQLFLRLEVIAHRT
ncbi:hypothetical protein [Tsukamurella soli]|uniref:hypothetical protein n=1 Tax=Tsukamurella soli TaxID=644556 RepID=UPI0031E8A77F